jgi:hypothetical protein
MNPDDPAVSAQHTLPSLVSNTPADAVRERRPRNQGVRIGIEPPAAGTNR